MDKTFIGEYLLAVFLWQPSFGQEGIGVRGEVERVSLKCVYVIVDLVAFGDKTRIVVQIILRIALLEYEIYSLWPNSFSCRSKWGRPLRAAWKRRKKAQSLIAANEKNQTLYTILVLLIFPHMQAFKYGMLTILVKSRGSSPGGKYVSTSFCKRSNLVGFNRR
jgi:hypothetical protein